MAEQAVNRRRLHHSGFVVASIEAAAAGFQRSLGATWDQVIFADEIQRVRVTFLSTGPDEAQLELIEPAADDAPVLRFLKEKGGGLHHLCFEIADIGRELADMRSRGSRIVQRPKPAVAFSGRRIAWLLTPENLLVELVEAEA